MAENTLTMPDYVVTLLVAFIPAAAAVISQAIISRKGRRDNDAKEAANAQKLADRLQTIENKLDEHNGYAKKIGQIERSLIRIDTIVSMNRRSSHDKKHFKR